jgi:hypothetical protein
MLGIQKLEDCDSLLCFALDLELEVQVSSRLEYWLQL